MQSCIAGASSFNWSVKCGIHFCFRSVCCESNERTDIAHSAFEIEFKGQVTRGFMKKLIKLLRVGNMICQLLRLNTSEESKLRVFALRRSRHKYKNWLKLIFAVLLKKYHAFCFKSKHKKSSLLLWLGQVFFQSIQSNWRVLFWNLSALTFARRFFVDFKMISK